MKKTVIDTISTVLGHVIGYALFWALFVLILRLACWCLCLTDFTIKWATGLWLCVLLVRMALSPNIKK